MNGQTINATQPPGILLAFTASCLIHAGVLFLPYLGTSARETRATARPAVPQAHTLNATLTTPRKTPFMLPPKQDDVPQPPVPLVPEADVAPQTGNTSPDDAPDAHQPADQPREGLNVLPLDAPLFYPTDQLTARPQLVETTELDTPEIKPIVASGKIVMKLWINNLGEVVEAEIEKSDLPETFGRSAVSVFRRMRFTPGQRLGKAVGTVMRIEISYDDGRKPPAPAAGNAHP